MAGEVKSISGPAEAVVAPNLVGLAKPPAGPVGPPGRLTIVGTGHVFQLRKTIRDAIHAWRPDVVFVELDRGRLQALLDRQRGVAPEPGGQGQFLHRKLHKFQSQVAGMYGAQQGEEMLAAVQAGQEVGAKIALIDPPAHNTVRKVLKEFTWRERFRLAGQLTFGGLQGLLRRGDGKASIEAEMKRYQDDPDAALQELGRQYPTIHRIVISDRDDIMASRIRKHLAGARHGVAVVGDGHVPGLLSRLADLEVETFRLPAVRDGRLPRPPASVATGTSADVGFGFDTKV